MKKIISLFMLSLCAMLLMTSCAKDEEDMTGTINGFVSELTNANNAIAGATVTISGKGLSKTTGSDGRFEFTELAPGTYTLQVSANTYQTTTKQVTVFAGQTAICDFQLEKSSDNVEISPVNLSFGQGVEQLSFNIKNMSNEAFTYSISNAPDFVEISPVSGTVAAKGTQAVSVHVKERSSITSNRSGQLTVNVGNNSYTVSINVSNSVNTDPGQSGGNDDGQGGDDNQGGNGGNGGSSDGSPVVPSGLYAYFTFEDNTKDLTDTGITATGIGTSFVESFNGTKALNIPANESCMLSIPNGLIDQREMSISFWVKDLYDGHVFHAIRNTDYRPYAFLLAVENGMLKFVPDPYYIEYQYTNQSTFTHGSLSGWHMITLVSDYDKTSYNVTTTHLYVDGDLIDTSTGASSSGNSYLGYENCTKVIVGGEMKTTGNYGPKLNAARITMDNLRVYKNRRLSADEIKTIYNAEKK